MFLEDLVEALGTVAMIMKVSLDDHRRYSIAVLVVRKAASGHSIARPKIYQQGII